VPKKEGKLYYYRNWKDILQEGHKEVKFLDNNFLAYPDHKKILQELIDSKIRVEFNQGLDIRLIDEENSKLLKKIKHGSKHTFAFDNIKDEKIVVEKLRNYLSWGSKNWNFRLFLYCNADMPLSNIIYRIMFCKKNRIMPYLMRDKNCWKIEDNNLNNFYKDIAAYCNFHLNVAGYTFEEYLLKYKKNKKRIKSSLKLWNDNYTEPDYLVWE